MAEGKNLAVFYRKIKQGASGEEMSLSSIKN